MTNIAQVSVRTQSRGFFLTGNLRDEQDDVKREVTLDVLQLADDKRFEAVKLELSVIGSKSAQISQILNHTKSISDKFETVALLKADISAAAAKTSLTLLSRATAISKGGELYVFRNQRQPSEWVALLVTELKSVYADKPEQVTQILTRIRDFLLTLEETISDWTNKTRRLCKYHLVFYDSLPIAEAISKYLES
jgi:hypothetical protein